MMQSVMPSWMLPLAKGFVLVVMASVPLVSASARTTAFRSKPVSRLHSLDSTHHSDVRKLSAPNKRLMSMPALATLSWATLSRALQSSAQKLLAVPLVAANLSWAHQLGNVSAGGWPSVHSMARPKCNLCT